MYHAIRFTSDNVTIQNPLTEKDSLLSCMAVMAGDCRFIVLHWHAKYLKYLKKVFSVMDRKATAHVMKGDRKKKRKIFFYLAQ